MVVAGRSSLSVSPVGRRALADDDPQVAELIKQGDADDAHGDTRDAIARFHEADKLSPDNAAIIVRLSKEYSDLIAVTKPASEAGKVAQTSLDYAKRAVELNPKSAKAHLALAIGYGRMTDFTDNKTKLIYSKYIKEEAEKSLAIGPADDYAYHVLGRWNYGIASLNPVLKIMAKYIYGGLPDASMEDAAAYFKKATEIAPQRIIHHLELARTYTALGKTELADKEWETILTLHPANAEDEAAQKEARETLKKHEGPAPAKTGQVIGQVPLGWIDIQWLQEWQRCVRILLTLRKHVIVSLSNDPSITCRHGRGCCPRKQPAPFANGLSASASQPARRQSPPSGVIGPTQWMLFSASTYKLPLKITIPARIKIHGQPRHRTQGGDEEHHHGVDQMVGRCRFPNILRCCFFQQIMHCPMRPECAQRDPQKTRHGGNAKRGC